MFLVDGECYCTPEDLADALITEECYSTDSYDEMLDDCYGDITFGNLIYSASEVLSKVDPIAYRYGFSDFVDAQISDDKYDLCNQLESLENGEEIEYNGYTVRCIEEEA